MAQNNPQPSTTFDIFQAIKSGFDLTTKHWWLLILPILFDSFLWLGLRLRIVQPVREFYDGLLAQIPSDSIIMPAGGIEQFYQLLEQTNLFTLLAVPILGVPILMGGGSLEQLPLVADEVVLTSIGKVLQLGFLFIIVGLQLSGIYYALIAHVVAEDTSWQSFFLKLPRNIARMLALGILIYLLLLMVIFPLIFGASLVGLINLNFASIALIGGTVFVMWAVIFTSFSAQAMLLEHLSPVNSIKRSYHFVKGNLNRTLPLLLIALFANSFLNQLWLLADNGSWLTVISIGGHAFVATSLLVATFIFFKENALTSEEA